MHLSATRRGVAKVVQCNWIQQERRDEFLNVGTQSNTRNQETMNSNLCAVTEIDCNWAANATSGPLKNESNRSLSGLSSLTYSVKRP